MRGYIIFSLAFFCIASFVLLVVQDEDLLVWENRLPKLGVGVYERLQNLEEKIEPSYDDSLTWVDIEGKFYFDQETINEIIKKRFYAREPKIEPGVYYIVVTGYSSTVAQCGPDPFITASGQKVRSGIAAANFLPFGAKIKMPEVFGDQVFEVQDRMAQRHWGRIDVWLPNYGQAARFGARRLKVEVL